MADFYGTAAGFTAYHEARGRADQLTALDLDNAEIEAALLIASEWLDGKYFVNFCGVKVGMRAQIREWPRMGVTDVNGYPIDQDSIPREVENATYEAAFRQLVTPGSLSVDYTPGKYESVAIDGAINVKFAKFNSAYDVQTQFAVIDGILSPLLSARNGNFSSFSGTVVRV